MVHTVVLAALVIGIVAIVPSAMAHHTDSTDEPQCKKWHLQAFTDYIEKGQVSPGIQKLLMECLQDGYSPLGTNLPPPLDAWYAAQAEAEEEENSSPPISNGLIVEVVDKEFKIPISGDSIETKLNPCHPGQIILEFPEETILSNGADVTFSLESDRITFLMTSINPNLEGTLLLKTSCLGIVN